METLPSYPNIQVRHLLFTFCDNELKYLFAALVCVFLFLFCFVLPLNVTSVLEM